jgi:hypothetical protein
VSNQPEGMAHGTLRYEGFVALVYELSLNVAPRT